MTVRADCMNFDYTKNWKETLLSLISEVMNLSIGIIALSVKKAIDSKGFVYKISLAASKGNVVAELTPYVAGVTSLAFLGMKPDTGVISRMLGAVNIKPDQRLMDIVGSVSIGNEIAYIPTIYLSLISKVEPTAERLDKVLESIGITPDTASALAALDYYHNSSNGSGALPPEIKEMASSAAAMISKMLIMELDRTSEAADIEEKIKAGFLPYIVASGVMFFLGKGKQINEESVGRVISALGLPADQAMQDYIATLNYGNLDISYVTILYFIKSSGRPISAVSMSSVARAMGIEPDDSLIDFILSEYGV